MRTFEACIAQVVCLCFTSTFYFTFVFMNSSTTMPHQGRAVKRIREILGIKQDALAIDLGLTQQAVSLLEQRETLDAPTLEKVAQILKVPKEAIEHFDEQQAVTYFNTFNDSSFSNSNGTFSAYNCTFNPMDKIIELVEENRKLYERLLQAEREKVEMLERLLKEGK